MINSKYVYCVSDCYLRALLRESEPYSFYIKGYCSLTEGINNLKYTNISDILGFVILIEYLDYNDVEYFNNLVELINDINLESDGHPVVLAMCNSEGYEQLDKYINTDNIKIFLVDNVDMMSDVIIRRDIYGTLVKELFEPYVVDTVYETEKNYSIESSNYDPIFRENIQRLCEPIVVAPDLRRAMENDEVLSSIGEDDDIAYFLRSEQLNRYYNNRGDNSIIFENILSGISDTNEIFIYRSIYNLIKEGKL